MAETAPAFAALIGTFARTGALSFGGAAGQIAKRRRVIVEEKRWLDETRTLHAVHQSMLLPGSGSETQQLATYVGWLMHGVRSGSAAGLLSAAPGAALVPGLSFLVVLGAGAPLIEGTFNGIGCAAPASIAQALRKTRRRGLHTAPLIKLGAIALAALLALDASFLLMVLVAGVAGAAPVSLTAAVVGVIAVVAPWFAPGAPLPGGLPDPLALALSALAFALVFRTRWSILPIVGLMAALGIAARPKRL